MKRRVLGAAIVCVLALGVTAFAEKKNIVVKEYPDIHIEHTGNTTYNYQVNGQGDIVTYWYFQDDTGKITAIYYLYTKKSGTDQGGQIGPGPKKTDDFLPSGSVSFEIVGLERNIALCLFVNNLGSRIYMVFRLQKDYANPTPNRTNYASHLAGSSEYCSLINGSQVLSSTYNPEVVKTVTNRARVGNTALLTTSTDHNLFIGDRVTILGVPDESYNLMDVEVLSVPTNTTFTYSCVGGDEASIASTGIVYRREVLNNLIVYNPNGSPWKNLSTKGIDSGSGGLAVINMPIQKYYQRVYQPNPAQPRFTISILKP